MHSLHENPPHATDSSIVYQPIHPIPTRSIFSYLIYNLIKITAGIFSIVRKFENILVKSSLVKELKEIHIKCNYFLI